MMQDARARWATMVRVLRWNAAMMCVMIAVGMTGWAAYAQNDAGGAAVELANATCPVLVDEPVKSSVFVEYEGKKIWFCCPMCRRKFSNEPEKYVANLPQFGGAAAAGAAAVTAGVLGADEDDETQEAAAGEESGGASRAQVVFGRFHIVTVHFPIALLIFAAIAEIGMVTTRRQGFASTVRMAIAVGAVSAVVAVFMGLAREETTTFPPSLHQTIEWHERLGISTAVLAVLAWLFVEWRRRTGSKGVGRLTTAIILLSAVTVGVGAHLGGTIAYWPETLFGP